MGSTRVVSVFSVRRAEEGIIGLGAELRWRWKRNDVCSELRDQSGVVEKVEKDSMYGIHRIIQRDRP